MTLNSLYYMFLYHFCKMGFVCFLVLWDINLCLLFNGMDPYTNKQVTILNNSDFSISTQFNCLKYFYFKPGTMGIAEYPFIAIAPRSTLARRGCTWQGLIYGLNRTNGILMLNGIVWLNWIAWNRNVFFYYETVLKFKLHAYVKLNYLKWNCFWHWNCTYTKLICLT